MPSPALIIRNLQAIERICDAHAVSIAATALQFLLGHTATASLIPGVGNAAGIGATIALPDHPTPVDFRAELAEALPQRLCPATAPHLQPLINTWRA